MTRRLVDRLLCLVGRHDPSPVRELLGFLETFPGRECLRCGRYLDGARIEIYQSPRRPY